MNAQNITPVNPTQLRIKELTDTFRNYGITSPEEIYHTLEDLYPFMRDEDMFYTDKLLNVAHFGRCIIGGCIINEVRVGAADAELFNDYKSLGDLSFARCRRTQFSKDDMFTPFNSLMVVAVKITNPGYGTSGKKVKFMVEVSTDGEGTNCSVQECEFEITAGEYTSVLYIPFNDFSDMPGFEESTWFYVKIYEAGTETPAFLKQCIYVDRPTNTMAGCNLVGSELSKEDIESDIEVDRWMDGMLELHLCTVMFDGMEDEPETMEIAMRMELIDTLTPHIPYLRFLKLRKNKNYNMYSYKGVLFGELGKVKEAVFKDGAYKITFYFMEQELFHSFANVNQGNVDICCSDFSPFQTKQHLGVCCDIHDILGIPYFKDEPDVLFDGTGEEDAQEDADVDDEFQKLLDEFIGEVENDSRDEVCKPLSLNSSGDGDEVDMKVKERGMCSSGGKDWVVSIDDSDYFFIRPGDDYLHLKYRVSFDEQPEKIFVECACLEADGMRERVTANIEIEDIIYVTVPINSLCAQKPEVGQKILFKAELVADGKLVNRKRYTGVVVNSIFDLFELGSVDISNEPKNYDLSKGLEPMMGFKLEEMNKLHLQFELKKPDWMYNITDNMMVELDTPQGLCHKASVEELFDNESGYTTFKAEYNGYSVKEWVEGRYVLGVYYRDNRFVDDYFIKITFTVGLWNVAGTYDSAKIKREILSEMEQEAVAAAREACEEEKSALEKLHSLIGLDEVKKEIEDLRQQLQLAKKREAMGLPADMPFLHARFYGNPGTGKTTVAKLLGQIYKDMGLLSKGHVVFAERKTLIAGRWYDSANAATMEAIDKAKGGILFIDEAYNLAVPEDPRDPGQDIISSLLTVLSDESKKDWMLILAGYPDKMEKMMTQNEGFKSRVPNVFHFNDYAPDDLLQIAHKYCREHVYTLTPEAEEHLKAVIERDYAKRSKNFDNGRYVINLLEATVIKRMGKRLAGVANPIREMITTILPEDIPSLKDLKRSRKLDMLNNMVGLTQLKESIQNHLNYVKLCNNRMMVGLGSQMPPLHMVFTGNPGTGKTTVADFMGEIYASMGILSEGNVLKYTKKDLVGFWIGDTEKTLRELFKRAKGNVLFIDEAYELNPHGDEKDRGRIILDALVDELGNDNADMIVILAGYRKEMEELLECNPGLKSRFPNVFHFNDYSVDELMKIALSSKVAEGYIFTPTAKQRLEAYIRREVLKKQKGFGNGRFVNRLISGTILPRMATRLSGVENPTKKQLQTIVAEDIPITAAETMAVNETGFNDTLINESLAKLDALVGLHKVKQAIHNFVDVARYRHSIGEKFVGSEILKWSFTGNTGTGKSTVARILADILKGMNLLAKGNFVEVKGEQIFNVSEYACDQVLKSAVDRSRYGMLFIDSDAPEFRDRGGYTLTNEQLKIKLMQLTAEHGGAGAIIIAECTAKRQALVSSMTSNGVYEFDHTFVFDDYTPGELYQILAQCLAAHKVRFTPEATACIKKYISAMAADKGAEVANARIMKLLSRTIYEIIMLRESRDTTTPRRTVCLGDVERFEWKKASGGIGYRR